MNFTKTTDKYIPDSIRAVAKANIEMECLINKCNKDGSTSVNNNNLEGSSEGGRNVDEDPTGEPAYIIEVYTIGGANDEGE